MRAIFTAVLMMAFAFSCRRHVQVIEVPQPRYIEVKPKKPLSEGSLFVEDSPFANPYSDIKARRVGDILVVRVVENIRAEDERRKEMSRRSNISQGLGVSFSKPDMPGVIKGFDAGVGLNSSNAFSGRGVQKSSNKLVALVAVRVIEVLPSGNLLVEGSKRIEHNGERYRIYVRGIVRPVDILQDNSVWSWSLADAHIRYEAEGEMARKTGQGWLAKILDIILPF